MDGYKNGAAVICESLAETFTHWTCSCKFLPEHKLFSLTVEYLFYHYYKYNTFQMQN